MGHKSAYENNVKIRNRKSHSRRKQRDLRFGALVGAFEERSLERKMDSSPRRFVVAVNYFRVVELKEVRES